MASKDFSIDDVVQAILADPKLGEALVEVGEDYIKLVQETWPDSIGDKTTPQINKDEVFELVKPDDSGDRPWVHVHVNHPYAVAHQARTGAFTKAAEAMGLEIRDGDD